MKSRIKRAASFGLLLALCGQPFGASAADSVKFKGRSANAFFVASGGATITQAHFQVDANLGSATLDATVTLTDTLSGTSLEVAVEDLNWAATSSRGRQNSHSNFTFQGCHTSFHVNGAFRLAEAVGTISDGTSNFTPDPSLAGNLFSAKSGDRSHGC